MRKEPLIVDCHAGRRSSARRDPGLRRALGNVGGAVDAVADGITGVLVDPTDPAAVAEAIRDLLASPDRAESMGREGMARARELAWPRIVTRVEHVLADVAGGAAGGPWVAPR